MNPTHQSPDDHEPLIVVVWARIDDIERETVRIFTADQYADWNETNQLASAFPDPVFFYGVTRDGSLIELDHFCHTGAYDEDDYATVTHTWTEAGVISNDYATGSARRDGRA